MSLLSLNYEQTCKVLRAELIASQDGLTTSEIKSCYKTYFGKSMGSTSEVENWLRQQSDLCRRSTSRKFSNEPTWVAVLNQNTQHVQQLVDRQQRKKRIKTKPSLKRYNRSEKPKHRNHSHRSPRRDQNGNYGRKMSQHSVPSTRPSRGKENVPLPERSVIIRDDPSSQSESSDLNQSDCYTESPSEYSSSIQSDQGRDVTLRGRREVGRDRPQQNGAQLIRTHAHESYPIRSRQEIKNQKSSRSESENTKSETDAEDRKAYIRKMREKMANEIQAKSVTIPLAELQSERESISLAHSRPKTPDRSAIFTAKENKKKNGLENVKEFLRKTILDEGESIAIDLLHDVFNADFLVTQSQRSPISKERFLAILAKLKGEFLVRDELVILLHKPEPVKKVDPPKIDEFKKINCGYGDQRGAETGEEDKIQNVYEMIRDLSSCFDRLETTVLSLQPLLVRTIHEAIRPKRK